MGTRIATLTLNPAVDMACSATAVRPTHKVRTFDERLDPGGGGINVARVVRALGGDALALIMTGGVTGRLVEELLDEAGVAWQALPIQGRTRISLNVHDLTSGLEYRFVPEGPSIELAEWQAALDALRAVEADWVVVSGSLPHGIPPGFLGAAAGIARQRSQKFALDTSGPPLRAALGQGITLLKLSLGELEYIVGHDLPEACAQENEIAALIRAQAAGMVVVSLGRQGAVLADGTTMIRLPAVRVEERSAVGAGDSFLAGLVLGLVRDLSPRQALAFGMAAGAAAVLTYGTAVVQRAEAERCYRKLCDDAGIPPDL